MLPHMPCLQAVALSELVLEVLARPGPDLASHTVDYFLMANTGGCGLVWANASLPTHVV